MSNDIFFITMVYKYNYSNSIMSKTFVGTFAESVRQLYRMFLQSMQDKIELVCLDGNCLSNILDTVLHVTETRLQKV